MIGVALALHVLPDDLDVGLHRQARRPPGQGKRGQEVACILQAVDTLRIDLPEDIDPLAEDGKLGHGDDVARVDDHVLAGIALEHDIIEVERESLALAQKLHAAQIRISAFLPHDDLRLARSREGTSPAHDGAACRHDEIQDGRFALQGIFPRPGRPGGDLVDLAEQKDRFALVFLDDDLEPRGPDVVS